MSTEYPQVTIAGHSVEQLRVGQHILGHVVINENVSVVFRMNDNPDRPDKCLACKISKIRECADVVCPDIKENDPNASCSDAITNCTELACQGSCSGSGPGGGGFIIIA
jgi:hypothetical protein